MHVFKFLVPSEKKKLSPRHPGHGFSSVHPASNPSSRGACELRAAHGVRCAKLLELFGAENEEEHLQIVNLIHNGCKQQQAPELEDSLSSSSCSDEEKEEDFMDRVDSSDSPSRRHPADQAWASSSPGLALGMMAARQYAFSQVRRNSASHFDNSRIRRAETISPRPLSPEKHYLPSPRQGTRRSPATEVQAIAHPLPAPPPPATVRNGASSPVQQSERHPSQSLWNPGRKPWSSPPSPRAGVPFVKNDNNHHVSIARKSDMAFLKAPPPTPEPPSEIHQPANSVHRHIARPRPAIHVYIDPDSLATARSPLPYSTPQHSPFHKDVLAHQTLSVQGTLGSPTPPLSQSHTWFSPAPISQSPPQSPWSQGTRLPCPHKWTKGATLGQGSFGTVFEGWNQEDGSFFAVKISRQEAVSPEIQQEVAVLSKLEHPNIVRYFGSSVEDGHLCIFLELVRMGSLHSILQKYGRFEDNLIRMYTRQILLGLEYLHQKKTIHRDIKCANILVDVNGEVKLSDFGVAKQVEESLASSVKGTPLYMAPEVLTAHGTSYSFPADIWSLGCTILEMADGKPPWSDLLGFRFFFKVKNGELPPIPEHLSPEGKDFVLLCLKFKPEDRPTAMELLQHPFVANAPTPSAITWSPQSPVANKAWSSSSPRSPNCQACANWHLSSPGQGSCFDQVLAGAHRAQTLLHGR